MPSTEPTWVIARLLGERLGDAEVGELDVAFARAQQVAGLDVAVHDAVAVRVVQPAQACATIASASATSSSPASRRISAHDWPVDVLHDDVVAAGGLVEAEVEDLDDVGVHEPGGGQRLAPEARDELAVVGQVLGEQLDRHVALQARVEARRRTVDMPPTPRRSPSS